MSHAVEVDPRIWDLRPDFAVAVIRGWGLANGPSDEGSTAALREAERRAVAALNGSDPATEPHVAAWREAYRAFGAKAQRTPSSAEALLRRVVDGEKLPGINRLVDLYNAMSLEYTIPVGGEDLAHIAGPSRLTIARGDEPFDVMKSGAVVNEPPAPGEVIWADDAGVTCRRWNWRQCVRTRLTDESRDAFFVLERLEPFPLPRLREAAADFVERLRQFSAGARIESWIVER